MQKCHLMKKNPVSANKSPLNPTQGTFKGALCSFGKYILIRLRFSSEKSFVIQSWKTIIISEFVSLPHITT